MDKVVGASTLLGSFAGAQLSYKEIKPKTGFDYFKCAASTFVGCAGGAVTGYLSPIVIPCAVVTGTVCGVNKYFEEEA